MPPIPPDKLCPDCRGKGSILLLVRTIPCKRCEGRGYLLISPLDQVVDDLRIPMKTRLVLKQLGASTLRDVVKFSEEQILKAPDMNKTAVDELKGALSKVGLGLRKG